MKVILTILFFFLYGYGFSQPGPYTPCLGCSLTHRSITYGGNFIGFIDFRPANYTLDSQRHPLIIFLHGIGERGNGTTELTYVYNQALPNLLAQKATMKFNNQSFVVLSPQSSTAYSDWQDFYTEGLIEWAKINMRIDTTRIYLVGISMGGGGCIHYVTSSAAHAQQIAAVVPVVPTYWRLVNPQYCSDYKVAAYSFADIDDPVVTDGSSYPAGAAGAVYFTNGINTTSPLTFPDVEAISKIRASGGHSWDWAMDTSHINQNPNIYEWLLTHKRTATPFYSYFDLGYPWQWWGPVQNEFICYINGVTAGSGGNPPIETNGYGTTLAQMELTPACQDSMTAHPSYDWRHNKLYKQFPVRAPYTTNVYWGRSSILVGNGGGTYSMWMYFPSNYSYPSTGGFLMTLFAHKKLDTLGIDHSDYSFSLFNLATLNTYLGTTYNFDTIPGWRSDWPILTCGFANVDAAYKNATPLPLGQWINLKEKVYAGDKVEWYLNNKLLMTEPNSFHKVGIDGSTSVWTWMVGHYGSNTGKLWMHGAVYQPNTAPTANAGRDTVLGSSTTSYQLNASGSTDPDGTIAYYRWKKVSGPNYSINNDSLWNPTVSGLSTGTYVFSVTAWDNNDFESHPDSVVVQIGTNIAPSANAGADLIVNPPATLTTLSGSGSDPDGTITSYAWIKISGPSSYSFNNAAIASPTVSSLVYGTYVFRLTVTDNGGATAFDDVSVKINQAPSVNAGSDILITLPVISTTLSGSATDADGTVSTYTWSKISGPSTYNIVKPDTAVTALNTLVAGTYVFRLTVTDNNGAPSTDDITVIVNQPPVSNAGGDILITSPASSTTLSGSGSDADGTISAYSWTKVSGPSSYNIVSPASASTAINTLTAGVYTFRLTVTDNRGATATDDIIVTVNQPPVANAGSYLFLQLPANTVQLNGTGSFDLDGTIVSYSWQKISGGAYTINNASLASPTISNLQEGIYVFRLTVVDNNGASATDDVLVTVMGANIDIGKPAQTPVKKAVNDPG